MKTIIPLIDKADKAILAINAVQQHVSEIYGDDICYFALEVAANEITALNEIFSKVLDAENEIDSVPAPIKARITKLKQPTISESMLSEFFEWLEATGEWTCDSTIFDSAWQRFKKSHA